MFFIFFFPGILGGLKHPPLEEIEELFKVDPLEEGREWTVGEDQDSWGDAWVLGTFLGDFLLVCLFVFFVLRGGWGGYLVSGSLQVVLVMIRSYVLFLSLFISTGIVLDLF